MLTSREVRLQLKARGFQATKYYKNHRTLASSICNAMRRLRRRTFQSPLTREVHKILKDAGELR